MKTRIGSCDLAVEAAAVGVFVATALAVAVAVVVIVVIAFGGLVQHCTIAGLA